MERSLVLVKPDGVQRALIGEVISRLERRGLRLVAAKFMLVSRELAEPFQLEKKELKKEKGMAGSMIVGLLPYLIVIWAFYGGMAAATDSVAGEKERNTLETLLISPRMYRELIKPRHKKLFDAQKRLFPKPFYCFLHSDGALMEILPDFIECGVEILNPVQLGAAGVDATVLKSDFGEKLRFWGGGVDTQHVLPQGTPEPFCVCGPAAHVLPAWRRSRFFPGRG